MSGMEVLRERARADYPERWAPDGEALAGYPGSSWEERLVAWRFAQRMAEARAPADDEPEIPASGEERCAECRTPYGDDWICHTWLTRPCRPHDHTDAGHHHDHDGTRVERPRVGGLAPWESEA